MKTITIKGHIVAEPAPSWRDGSESVVNGIHYYFAEYADPESKKTVCEYTMAFQLPEGFDPVSQAVKELEEQREELRAKFQMAVNEINNRIGKLSALTNEVKA